MTVRRVGATSLAGLILMIQSIPVLAQTAPPEAAQPDTAAGAIADPAIDDDTIIVTAQRRAQTLERTPVAVAVLSAETLANQVIVSEADLQFAAPGLTVKAGQGSNQLNYSIRGQTVDAFTSSRPSVLPYFNEVQVGGVGASWPCGGDWVCACAIAVDASSAAKAVSFSVAREVFMIIKCPLFYI